MQVPFSMNAARSLRMGLVAHLVMDCECHAPTLPFVAGKDAVEVLAGAPWLKAFDTGVYTIWGASLLFDLKERYLARLPLFTKLSAG